MKSIFSPPLTGGHVLAMILAFFGVIFAVNGIFIYVAEKTFSGLETTSPFVKGIEYNKLIKDAEMQRQRGWIVSLDQGGNELAAKYQGRDGQPLEGLDVTAFLSRAATDRYDIQRNMKALGKGRYTLALDLPLKGQWLLRVEAKQNGRKMHIVEQTIFVK